MNDAVSNIVLAAVDDTSSGELIKGDDTSLLDVFGDVLEVTIDAALKVAVELNRSLVKLK